MKLIIIATLLSLQGLAQAESILSKCYDAAHATDYVYKDRFIVSIDTRSKNFDHHVQEKFWQLLTKREITILAPKDLEVDSTFGEKKAYNFKIKVNLSKWQRSDNILRALSEMNSVRVACQYRI